MTEALLDALAEAFRNLLAAPLGAWWGWCGRAEQRM